MRDNAADKVMAALREQPQDHQAGPPQPGVRLLATILSVGFNTLSVTVDPEAETPPALTVAKPTKVCPALDQDIDGYTYSYNGDLAQGQSRTSTSGSDVENQVLVPRFIVGDLVEIGPAPSNLGDYAVALADVRMQVVNSPVYWFKESE